MNCFKQFSLVLVLLATNPIFSQAEINSKLYLEIQKADSLLFEQGFNRCNLRVVKELTKENLLFFHDQNGIQDYATFIKNFEESICSSPERKPIRQLVEGSLEVFPLYDEGVLYGAIQKGVHEFYIKEPNKEMFKTNIARFTQLWMIEEGNWKLNTILSYDHQIPKKDYGPKFESYNLQPLFEDDEKIEELIKNLNVTSLALGYINQGEIQQIRTFGEMSKGKAIRYNSIYKVASLTKPITALITLKLVEQNLWSLEEPISNYYVHPDLKDNPYLNKLNSRNILTHQSGLPNWAYLQGGSKLKFNFEPGTDFQYSGEGYECLRKALEIKFNTTLEKLAEDLIFKPLNMTDSSFYWNEKTEEKRYAPSHDENGKELQTIKYYKANAAANLLTTIGDYSKFMVYLMKGAGLSENLFQDFIYPHSYKKQGVYWGLGCEILPDLTLKEDFAVMHGGGDYGLKTLMILIPTQKKGIVIFSNSENGMRTWKKLVEAYFGELGEEIVKRQLE